MIQPLLQPNQSKTLSEWLGYLSEIHPLDMELGLGRIQSVLKSTGWGSFTCPVITVAGTNGKGSCIKLLESILLSAGYRVGAYISPHLLQFNERININAVPVQDEKIIQSFQDIEKLRGNITLTLFEFVTLAGIRIFLQAKLDVVLLEVGLGGRLDAVNVVDSDLAMITSIAMDHCEVLGNNRESIGREKAGVFRYKKPAVCGDVDVPDSILAKADEMSLPFYLMNRDFTYEKHEKTWSWSSRTTSYKSLPLPSLKLQNAASSLMAIELLQPLLPVNRLQIEQGLKSATLPGRIEQRTKPVNFLLDVAHNPHSARWLAKQLQEMPVGGKTRAVFAMLKDKDISSTARCMLSVIDEWYVAGLNAMRGASSTEIHACLTEEEVRICYSFDSVEEALKEAIIGTALEDRIVVFGSFHTVAAAHFYLDQMPINE